MSTEVEFYMPSFVRKTSDGKEEYLNFSLGDFFSKIENLQQDNPDTFFRDINGKNILLSKIQRTDLSNTIVLPFGKLKDDKLYANKNDSFQAIDEKIYDVSSIAYNPNYDFVIKTVNINPSIICIQEYLSSFIPKELGYKLEFVPIYQKLGIEEIKNAAYVRRLILTFNTSDVVSNHFLENMYDSDDNVGIFKKMFSLSKNELNSKQIQLTLSVGRERKNSMNIAALQELIYSLDINDEVLSEIEVVYKENDDTPPKSVYKNKSMKLRYKFPLKEKHISAEYLLYNCLDVFSNYRSDCEYFVDLVKQKQIETDTRIEFLNANWSPNDSKEE